VPAKVEPAVQPEIPAEVELAAQAKPKVLAKVEPAARAARAQVSSMKKESRQQQAAQSTEPPWSRDADSFVTHLFFGTKIHAARAEARPNRVWFRQQRHDPINFLLRVIRPPGYVNERTRWSISKQNLIERFGANIRLPDLREEIANCSRSGQWHDGCMVRLFDLGGARRGHV
jgi:hypothetical protein